MSRERLFAPYRLAIVGIIGLLVILGWLGARGPVWWQRTYHPLRFEREIDAAALRHRVNPYLIAAVINAESGFDAGQVSEAGATGLMQLLPTTAQHMREQGVVTTAAVAGRPLSDPAANIEYGTAYLRYLVDRYHEVAAVLAAYNAGLGNADMWVKEAEGGDVLDHIAYPETRHYVLRVMRARDRYERLYPKAFPEWRAAQ